MLDASTNDPSGFSGFKEVTWDGATVWSYLETRSTYHPHHDFTRIFNPELKAYTTLYIANEDLTYDQLVAAGADPARTPSTGAQMDAIVEVDSTGTIVWEWSFFDHVVQDYDAAKPNYVGAGDTIADYPAQLDLNLEGHNLKNDWTALQFAGLQPVARPDRRQLGVGRILRDRSRRHVCRRKN